ncbi:MAG: DegT/DnrJ/EryC1/StrS family aminotransferase [Bacteroidota bacterium]
MNIRMVDTITQYQAIQQEVDEAVRGVITSGIYINGPVVGEFKKSLADYLGAKHVIPCANGTDALQIALMALGLQPGDEVITPSFTYVATVEVIALLQLKPIFVDVDPRSFNIDVSQVSSLITDRTKAIIPVHLFGQAANMEEVMKVAEDHDLFVVEDDAQAIGATYKHQDGSSQKTGTIGHIGCTSFYPSKNLGAFGDGGAIFTNDDELADKITVICNHGCKVRYYHDSIGVNSRLDALQAAILNVKLKHLDTYNAARRKAADMYDALIGELSGVMTPWRAPWSDHVFHQYTLRIEEGRAKRDAIKAHFDAHKVPAMIYYPVSLHQQKAYAHYWDGKPTLPVSEKLTEEVISLPMHSELTEEQIHTVVDTLKSSL